MTVAPDAAQTPAGGGWVSLPWRSAMAGAVVVTLLRPLAWALGLAGFLAGGGLILIAWPILVLPTPTGLQNALGGPISSLVFGSATLELLALLIGGVAGVVFLLLLLILAGAWAERQGIGVALEAAATEGLAADAQLRGAPGVGRVAVVRLLGLVPVAVAIWLAWRPLYDTVYRELILPDDLVTPLPVRVIGDIPGLLFAVGLVWLLADAASAVGVRRLVLERRSVPVAWLLGWVDLVRRPLRILPTALFGAVVTLLMILPALAAAGLGWTRVRDILTGGRDPATIIVAVGIWVSIWLGGLVLAGVGAGIRASAWTLEVPRRRQQSGTSPG